jgi:hypothetical protein
VHSRLVRQRTTVINHMRGFLIERGITVRQGPRPLRKEMPEVSPRSALATLAASYQRARRGLAPPR